MRQCSSTIMGREGGEYNLIIYHSPQAKLPSINPLASTSRHETPLQIVNTSETIMMAIIQNCFTYLRSDLPFPLDIFHTYHLEPSSIIHAALLCSIPPQDQETYKILLFPPNIFTSFIQKPSKLYTSSKFLTVLHNISIHEKKSEFSYIILRKVTVSSRPRSRPI